MKKFIFTFMVCLFAIAMDAQNDWTVVYSSATSNYYGFTTKIKDILLQQVHNNTSAKERLNLICGAI